MGSWSESCGFSGLEIGEGEEAYVMVLKGPTFSYDHSPFDLFVPVSPLIKGTYNDYGYLTIEDDDAVLATFNKQTGLNLQQGDDFDRDHIEGMTSKKLGDNFFRYWIHGSIFDRLGELCPEFPYVYQEGGSVKIKNINEAVDEIIGRQLREIKVISEDIANAKKDSEGDANSRAMNIALLLMRSRLSSSSDRLMEVYNTMLQDSIVAGEDHAGILTAKRRLSLLQMAAYELRKKIVPSEGSGPQHNGEVASTMFSNIILETQEARRKERYDYDDEEEVG